MDTTLARLNRRANSLPMGNEIFSFLKSEEAIEAMTAASATGLPAIAGISSLLINRFESVVQSDGHKRFIGMAVRYVLEGCGFEHMTRTNIEGDPLFSSGARYRRQEVFSPRQPALSDRPPKLDDDLLTRILSVLSADEWDRVEAALPAVRRNSPRLA